MGIRNSSTEERVSKPARRNAFYDVPMIAPIVDPAWLRAHRDDAVVADVRWYLDGRSGRIAYEQGHIPGAIFVELEQWLAGASHPDRGRHPLPDPAVFSQGMAQLGIADEDTVIAYDDAGGVIAARLVWMLRATGREATLLNGGIAGYDGPLETRAAIRSPATFSLRPWPATHLADITEVTDDSQIVIDARDRARYSGDDEPIDPRAGHIPGAHNLPCRENLDSGGALLPHDELRQRFDQLGAKPGASVISYCGSGVTACHNLLVMEQIGLGRGRLYPGSWSQYSHTDRPAALGAAPG